MLVVTLQLQKLWGLNSQDAALKNLVKDGSVLGVSYDQSSGPPTINFFIDGNHLLGKDISGIKGVVTPACGIDGAALTCNFGHTFAKPPEGFYAEFDGVMLAGKMI